MLADSLRAVVAQTLFKRADKPGRVAALEILVNTSAVSNLIREGKLFQIPSMMQTGSDVGMMTFEGHITQLLKEGKISKEDAAPYLPKKRAPISGAPEAPAEPTKPSGPLGAATANQFLQNLGGIKKRAG